MPGATGPELPPHLLAKRKRKQEEEAARASIQPPKTDEAPPADSSPKRRKVLGPSAPPAPLDERPPEPASANDSDSDDDIGPAPPSAAAHAAALAAQPDDSDDDIGPVAPQASAPAQGGRDAWMTMPPTADSLSRIDPSKGRARGFKTGPDAGKSTGGGGMSAIWTETPEEKRKRLENEVLGAGPAEPEKKSDSKKTSQKNEQDRRADEEKSRRIKESRGPSMLESHQKSKGIAAEDDPSKRAFDWEKDMKAGTMGSIDKKELTKKSTGFNSRFSGGGFL